MRHEQMAEAWKLKLTTLATAGSPASKRLVPLYSGDTITRVMDIELSGGWTAEVTKSLSGQCSSRAHTATPESGSHWTSGQLTPQAICPPTSPAQKGVDTQRRPPCVHLHC